MAISFAVDLEKVSKAANVSIPVVTAVAFVAGHTVSFYFHFVTVPMLMLTGLSLGADAVYTARGFMLALGCIQALQCNANTCPVGITTHEPHLQRGLDIEGKAQRVYNYVHSLEHDWEEALAALGRKSFRDLGPDNILLSSRLQGDTLLHRDEEQRAIAMLAAETRQP